MDILVERHTGLDVHKDAFVACIVLPGEGRRRVEQAEFGTTANELSALRDWLAARNVSVVGLESTSVYWKTISYRLEDDFSCCLLNARHLENIPGRMTDLADAAQGRVARRARFGAAVVRVTAADP